MFLSFPAGFFWGTSTAAATVETADHSWEGTLSADGHVFEYTANHEEHRVEDAAFIAKFGSVYRCSVNWSRLQTQPCGKFNPEVTAEYCEFFKELEKKGIGLMFVLQHWDLPEWFELRGGWTSEDNIPFYLDFVRQCVKHFGDYVRYWNTFHEPNAYAYSAYLSGKFPPHQKYRYATASLVLENMGRAHEIAFYMIREKSDAPIGISLHTVSFKETNVFRRIQAVFLRRWFLTRAARYFRKCDFWGLSYYAYGLFEKPAGKGTSTKHQLPQQHYSPEGFGTILKQFQRKYGKPIIVTENGLCTDDQQSRISNIHNVLRVCHQAIAEGVDIRGYIHKSTFDTFEWHLGPTYRFGLVRIDFSTMERSMTEAGVFYEKTTRENGLESR